MAEVDPKLCIALDDINEAMDCETAGNMGGNRTVRHLRLSCGRGDLAGLPEKDGMPRFRLKKPAHWSETWS